MKSATATHDFLYMGEDEFIAKANFVFSCMTGNAHFPSPTPTLATLDAAIKDYLLASMAAKTRDSTKISAKKQMHTALSSVLIGLAAYVNYTAQGDRTKIISSGFTPNAETSTPKVLGVINNFTVVPGEHPGEMVMSLDSVANRTSYIFLFEQTPIVRNAWQHVVQSEYTAVIKGLESLKEHSFRVCVSGTRNQVLYSQIITKIVL